MSRHLGLLRDAGLVRENRDEGFTYCQASVNGNDNRQGAVWPLLKQQVRCCRVDGRVPRLRCPSAGGHQTAPGASRDPRDRARRRQPAELVPGRSWAAWSRALGLLLPPLRVADLGCGDGHLTIRSRRMGACDVVAVDRSKRMLARAWAVAHRAGGGGGGGGGNITWKHGEIEALPIDDASVDLALLSQTLHHATDPELVVREATRIVTDGGRVLGLDLAPRDQDWVKERLGDRWLGFERAKLDGMMSDAGLVDVAVRTAIDPAPLGVIVDVGTKPQRAVSQLARRSPSSRSRSRGRR